MTPGGDGVDEAVVAVTGVVVAAAATAPAAADAEGLPVGIVHGSAQLQAFHCLAIPTLHHIVRCSVTSQPGQLSLASLRGGRVKHCVIQGEFKAPH